MSAGSIAEPASRSPRGVGLEPIEVAPSPALLSSGVERRPRCIHEHGPLAVLEQLVVDDTDPAADVQHAGVSTAGADHVEQEAGSSWTRLRRYPSGMSASADARSKIEKRSSQPRRPQSPKIASSSKGAVVSSWS